MTREHAATASTRQAVRRDDGELVGFVRDDPDGAVPTTVFGAALGPATNRAAAVATVLATGMASLAQRWWVITPDGESEQVWLLEVRADRVKVSGTDPAWGRARGTWVPGARLSLRRPEGG